MASAIDDFFKVILAGESETYNDYNWYVCNGSVQKCLRSYIEGKSTKKYGKLTKPLSEYTVGEVMAFQKNARSGDGQLFATGRYQFIPSTLKDLVEKSNTPANSKFNKETQDKLAYQLLISKPATKAYIFAENEDNKDNLEKAALGVAQIWSSVGVPYATNGKYGRVEKNQSFYSGGGDKASEPTEAVQDSLKQLRKNKGNFFKDSKSGATEKNNLTKTVFFVALLTVAGFVLLTETSIGKKVLSALK